MPILESGVVSLHTGESVRKFSTPTREPSMSVDKPCAASETQHAVNCQNWLGLNSNGDMTQELHSESVSGSSGAQQAANTECTFSSSCSNFNVDKSQGLNSGHGQDLNADSDIYKTMRNRDSLTNSSVLSAEYEMQRTVIGKHCIDASATLEDSRLSFGAGTSDDMNRKSSLFSSYIDQSSNDSGYLFEHRTPMRNSILPNIGVIKTPDKTCRSQAFENHRLKSFKSPRRKWLVTATSLF